MTARLAGRTALVTGAGTGIGKAIADRFVVEGARVVYADRDAGAAEAAASQQSAIPLVMDIADESAVERGFALLAEQEAVPDVVVANAGVQLFGQDAPIADLDLAAWERTISVNLTGTFLTIKHAVRAMLPLGAGSIIATGSPTGLNGEGSTFTAYAASKGGVHALVRAAAMAYASAGIRVNTVVPGYTETGLVKTISTDTEARRAIVGRVPMGRPGTPEDVTGAMVFLASDESSYATGSIFRVDGGMTSL